MCDRKEGAYIGISGNLAENISFDEDFQETTDPVVLNNARHRIKKALMRQFEGASEVQKVELNHILKRL